MQDTHEDALMTASITLKLQQVEQHTCQNAARLSDLLQRLQRIEHKFPSLRGKFESHARDNCQIVDHKVKSLESSSMLAEASKDHEISKIHKAKDHELLLETRKDTARDLHDTSTNIDDTTRMILFDKSPLSNAVVSKKKKNLIGDRFTRGGSVVSSISHSTKMESQDSSDDISIGNHSISSSVVGEDLFHVFDHALSDKQGDFGKYTGVVSRLTGKPHGLGLMLYDIVRFHEESYQRIYNGDWLHGCYNGHGFAIFSNGDSYHGYFRRNVRHGKGKYVWADGRVYEGEFVEEMRQGKGIFVYPNGARYEGSYHNGQKHGSGQFVDDKGGKYTGNWVKGKFEGHGVFEWEDGRIYRGEWRDGKANGKGVEFYANGQIYHRGLWVDDEPLHKTQPSD